MTVAVSTNGRKHETRVASRVLVISLESRAGGGIASVLRSAGFAVDLQSHQPDTAARIGAAQPHVVLLALPSPDARAPFLCREIRQYYDAALIICSPGARPLDVVSGLEEGADDYLILPMSAAELVARLRSLLRRLARPQESSANDQLIAGDLEIRLRERRVLRKGSPIHLPPTQFRLLVTLVREAGRVVTHADLLARAWGPEYVDSRSYIRGYIKRLRSQIEDDPSHPRLIVSERGVGYRLDMNGALAQRSGSYDQDGAAQSSSGDKDHSDPAVSVN